ncbi:MAG: hypothetical protein AAGD07_22650 [Planctomycetota bacterium]
MSAPERGFPQQASRGDVNKKAIYSDALGHPQRMLKTLSQLVCLKVIYQVDLEAFDYDTGYVTDLKAIATKVAESETQRHRDHRVP